MTKACKKITNLLFFACSCLLFSSCAAKEVSSKCFIFDTYADMKINGVNAENVLSAVNSSFEDMSEAFSLCYETQANELSENNIYRDCFEKTSYLRKIYGEKVNVSCGALTRLWGISTDSPKVPKQSEINEALNNISCDNYGDFTEGMYLDFGAVAKGYACDNVYAVLNESEINSAVISLSSTVLFYGEKRDGEKFKTGVTDPFSGSGFMGTLSTPAAFISTSGGYERFFESDGNKYPHILDTQTGYPVNTDLVSVTVIVPAETENGGIMSDFLATLIYSEGSENLPKYLSDDAFDIIAVTENKAVYTNCESFELSEDGGFYYG